MAIAPAAAQLVQQVRQVWPRATYEYGPPDGIGFQRTVTFDKRTSKALGPVLLIVDDPRVRDLVVESDKRVTVVFVADTRADHRTPFPLAEVQAIIGK